MKRSDARDSDDCDFSALSFFKSRSRCRENCVEDRQFNMAQADGTSLAFSGMRIAHNATDYSLRRRAFGKVSISQKLGLLLAEVESAPHLEAP